MRNRKSIAISQTLVTIFCIIVASIAPNPILLNIFLVLSGVGIGTIIMMWAVIYWE